MWSSENDLNFNQCKILSFGKEYQTTQFQTGSKSKHMDIHYRKRMRLKNSFFFLDMA